MVYNLPRSQSIAHQVPHRADWIDSSNASFTLISVQATDYHTTSSLTRHMLTHVLTMLPIAARRDGRRRGRERRGEEQAAHWRLTEEIPDSRHTQRTQGRHGHEAHCPGMNRPRGMWVV